MENFISQIGSVGAELGAAAIILEIFYVIFALGILAATIFLEGNSLTRIAHKLGVFGKEVMAYLPIASDIYRMKMAGFNPALGLLLDGTGVFCVGLVTAGFTVLTRSYVVMVILGILGLCAVMFFSFKYYSAMLQKLGFNKALAYAYFVAPLAVLFLIIRYIVAYSNKFDVDPEEIKQKMAGIDRKIAAAANSAPAGKKGGITGVAGQYAGNRFEIGAGELMTFGRDPARCNVLFNEQYASVSRVHCIVKFVPEEGVYYITDMSSNGTLVDGILLGKNNTRKIPAGSSFALGDEKNTFRVG